MQKPDEKNWKKIIPQTERHARRRGPRRQHVRLQLPEGREDAGEGCFDMDGKFVRDVELPGIGTASGFGGKRTDTETFYTFPSFATPPTIYRYDMITGKSKLLRRAKVKFDPDDYEVKQIFYTSKDGTRVPMFLAHKKGLKLDGTNPTLLYGYGGFNISLTPAFSISRLQWMEMGGVLAVANLRGGGEYGDAWHKAGTKLNKQNVFDDFIAAAEWLIAEKYTTHEEARDSGRQQRRPAGRGVHDAAAGPVRRLPARRRRDGHAAVPQVHRRPILDRRLRLARQPGRVPALLIKYSPYHNLKAGNAVSRRRWSRPPTPTTASCPATVSSSPRNCRPARRAPLRC